MFLALRLFSKTVLVDLLQKVSKIALRIHPNSNRSEGSFSMGSHYQSFLKTHISHSKGTRKWSPFQDPIVIIWWSMILGTYQLKTCYITGIFFAFFLVDVPLFFLFGKGWMGSRSVTLSTPWALTWCKVSQRVEIVVAKNPLGPRYLFYTSVALSAPPREFSGWL